MNRARTKVIRDQLRIVEEFLREWDPIGVIADSGRRLDEYDGYASGVLGRLSEGIGTEALATHLYELASGALGVPGDIARERSVARRLIIWWANELKRQDGV